jgi:hypothetical protein
VFIVFGLFDPPQTKAQKRAARSAQSLREQAARDASIEVSMLVSRHAQAQQVLAQVSEAHKKDAAVELMKAVRVAQDTLDKVERFTAIFPTELAKLQRSASNAAGFEALATFELEARDVMVKIRDEAKSQLVPLGVKTMEVRDLLS